MHVCMYVCVIYNLNLEDLAEAMEDRDRWQERIRGLYTVSMT